VVRSKIYIGKSSLFVWYKLCNLSGIGTLNFYSSRYSLSLLYFLTTIRFMLIVQWTHTVSMLENILRRRLWRLIGWSCQNWARD
jgi:hypothetical protein